MLKRGMYYKHIMNAMMIVKLRSQFGASLKSF